MENKPKIRIGTKRTSCNDWWNQDVPVYVSLGELKIQGKLTERDLGNHTGETVIFERGDVALEGRLYLRDKEGSYNNDVKRNVDDRYVVKATNGHDIPCPWDKVTSGLGVRNPVYDHWDIYLESGDRLIFHSDPKRKYEVVLEELCS